MDIGPPPYGYKPVVRFTNVRRYKVETFLKKIVSAFCRDFWESRGRGELTYTTFAHKKWVFDLAG